MAQPEILILTHDAPEYPLLLDTLSGEGVVMTVATTVSEALELSSRPTIILGEPDLVAELLVDWPEVHWVQSSWAGVTPLLDCGRQDFLLTGIKDAFGPQMSEYVLAYLLAREVRLFERLGRQANRSWWNEPSGSLRGKTLGVMGTGSIGSDIARAAGGFGMRLLGFSRTGKPVDPFETIFAGDQLAEFLPPLDYLVAVLPDTPETRRLLGAPEFALLKKDCYLVNVGRGSLIDEAALSVALAAGELAGAVLDVFETEPLGDDNPLWHSPNLLVTGHIAAISHPREIAGIFERNYRKYCEGESLEYRIDFARGY
ncbi:D-2-hydroxyacid dehydrogenase [Pseudomonadota bacterium]